MPKNNNKPNGFRIFMEYIKCNDPNVKHFNKNMSKLVQYCDPLWKSLNPEEKQKYIDKAKSIKTNMNNVSLDEFINKTKFTNNSPTITKQPLIHRSNTTKTLSLYERIKIFIDECKSISISHEIDLWKTMTLDTLVGRQSYLFIDIQCYEDIPLKTQYHTIDEFNDIATNKLLLPPNIDSDFMTLNKIDCIPAEITIVEYNFMSGLVGCYHDFVDISNHIPIGYMSRIKYATDNTHRIPIHGLPFNSIEQVIFNINDIFSRSRSNVFYCKSSSWKNISQSLHWLKHVSNTVCNISKVIDFEDLVINLESYIIQTKSLSYHHLNPKSSDILNRLNSTYFDFRLNIQCPFHHEIDCNNCSLKNVLSFIHVMTQVFVRILNIPITSSHHPTAKLALNTPFENIPYCVFNKNIKNISNINRSEKIMKENVVTTNTATTSTTATTTLEDAVIGNLPQKLTNFDLFRY